MLPDLLRDSEPDDVCPDAEGPLFLSEHALFEVNASLAGTGVATSLPSLGNRGRSPRYGTAAVPFNPYADDVVNDSIVRTFATVPPLRSIHDARDVVGAGVYALYYTGIHPLYEALVGSAGDAERVPIYVGKAASKGGRKGGSGAAQAATSLGARLGRHRDSLWQATDLDPDDFLFRCLVTVPLWVRPIEDLLIEHYLPVWNVVADGFGNHDPGKGRKDGALSRWDTLHVGRSTARRGSGTAQRWNEVFRAHPDGAEEIEARVREHLAVAPLDKV